MKKIAVILFALLSTTVVEASDYQVEVIIFENVSENTDSEIWQIEGVLPALPESIELTASEKNSPETVTDKATQFVMVPVGNYKLTELYNGLSNSSKYHPLMHLAWEQPALEQGEAEYVRLTLKDQEPGTDGAIYDDLIRLDGVVRVRSAQFLHVDVHLLYLINPLPLNSINYGPDNTDQSQEALIVPEYQALYAEMKETRRLKLNELYYFDHPGFGLILRISRIEEDPNQ